MAKLITLEVTKSYKTRENAVAAFEKLFKNADLRYLVLLDEATGRYFPVCLDTSKAMRYGVHFHFHVVG